MLSSLILPIPASCGLGTITEEKWHELMESVLRECRRIVKPQGSVVVVIQPNYEVVGRMRLWPWEFVCWASRQWPDWGLVEDVYSFSPDALRVQAFSGKPACCENRSSGASGWAGRTAIAIRMRS